jgi:hypothetical protein
MQEVKTFGILLIGPVTALEAIAVNTGIDQVVQIVSTAFGNGAIMVYL